MTRNLISILSFLLLSVISFSVEMVQLKDGRKILIKEDFTWEEIITSDTNPEASPLSHTKDLSIDNFTDKSFTSVSIKEVETKVLMEKYPNLLNEDLKGGINVKVTSSSEEKDNITYFFDTSNNSSASVIRVEVDILLLDDKGNILHTVTDYVYKGFNRMAETYIRVGGNKEGTLKIEKINNWNGKVRIIIKNIESR